jgi:4-hydroxy-3-methylbut-2-enyl diphosphate reductase
MGEVPHSILLVEDEDDVAKLTLPKDAKVAFLTQTTLSVDETTGIIQALRNKYPQIVGPAKSDICYATQNRQEAVKDLSTEAQVVLVLGSQNSSNSNRLADIAKQRGKSAYLIDTVRDIRDDWFRTSDTVLVTAGASAPEENVLEVIEYLKNKFHASVESRVVREEHVNFPLPRELRGLPILAN